jgi:hypothetical protein
LTLLVFDTGTASIDGFDLVAWEYFVTLRLVAMLHKALLSYGDISLVQEETLAGPEPKS